MLCQNTFYLACGLLLGMAGASRELSAWWYEDGRITWEQQQDLNAVADDASRWCSRVELWLGTDEASAQNCLELESPKPQWRAGLRGSAALDSSGKPYAQQWNAQTNVDNFRLSATMRADSGWNSATLERAQGTWKNRFARMVVGDFGGTDAGLDAWTGDFRGGLAEGRSQSWTGALLVGGPQTGGVHGGYRQSARGGQGHLWLLMVLERPLVLVRVANSVIQGTSRFAEPRQGSWNQARYRLPLEPLRITLGGDLHLRTGHQLPPLLDLPASFADVRIWSAHWQEWQPNAWRFRIAETAVQRVASDSTALVFQGERRHPIGRLALAAACRAVRTDCGLPRIELSAGLKPFPRHSDSLFSEARLQGTRITELPHAPRLRCGWDRQMGPRVRLGQSLTLPENWSSEQSLTVRQQSQIHLPAGLDTRLALRWSMQIKPNRTTRLGTFGGTVEARF
jgi:hypothetical protein